MSNLLPVSEEQKLNVTKLQELAKSNPEAELILKDFASRKRLRKAINIDSLQLKFLRSGQKLNPEKYKEGFKTLQELGVGSIVYGRKNNPTKFYPDYSLIDIGSAAFEGEKVDEIKMIDQPMKRKRGRPKGSRNKTMTTRRKRGRPRVNEVPLVFKLILEIPSNITQKQADALALKVRSFPKRLL